MPVQALEELEDLLTKVLERLRVLEEENRSLTQEVKLLRKNLEELEEETSGQNEEVARLQGERRKIRVQVERAIQNLAVLEHSD